MFTLAWAVALALAGALQAAFGQPPDNLARGRPYTLDPAPNYALSSPDPERKLLTDGQRTSRYFWTQPTTVGWQRKRPVTITIDLGAVKPIGGMSYRTAAGTAQVEWPESIDIYVSEDSRTWRHAGDLVALSAAGGAPPAQGYAVHDFRTDRLRARGRYVALQISSDLFVFVDEIEVYRGPDALLRARPSGAGVTDIRDTFRRRRSARLMGRWLAAEADRVRSLLRGAHLPAQQRTRLTARLAAARARGPEVPPSVSSRALLPYGEGHEEALAVRAAAMRARGMTTHVWTADRWAPLRTDEMPPADAPKPSLEVTMLRGEVRGAALNIAHFGEQAADAEVRVSGVPGVTVLDVTWTATHVGTPVASALPQARRLAPGRWAVRCVPGLTRQVWLSVDTSDASAGTHRGTVTVTVDGKTTSVPLRVHVARARMPERLSLGLGGWDYTEKPTYGITEANMAAVVAFLKRYHVDSPWAAGVAMPFGAHDSTGRMTRAPSTEAMDRWLARWPNARRYYVFPAFSGKMPETPAARRRVQEWIRFWVAHLRSRGVEPQRLALLIADEPNTREQDEAVVSWSRTIREAEPQVELFTDPTWLDPRQTSPELLEVSTILSPQRPIWIAARSAHEAVYLPRVRGDRELAFYSCSGPVRSLDPYSYHRLQAWECFRYGAASQAFWAFGDNGGASSWNEPASEGFGYSPQFLDAEGCTTSKHMEAVREGLYDHQTLTLLREAADAAAAARRLPHLVERARQLLEEGPRRVTQGPGADQIFWAPAKDRTVADRVRVQAIGLLEQFTEP